MNFRKIISIAFVILLIGGIAFSLTPGYKKSPGTGEIRSHTGFPYDPPKTFRLVRYVQTNATWGDNDILTKDCIVAWSTTDADGITVTETGITQDSTVAGVLAQSVHTQKAANDGNTATQDYGKRNWTWLQTYGYCTVIADNGTPTTGDALGTGTTTPGRARAVDFHDQFDPENCGIAGFWLSDPTAAGEENCKAFIRCE